MPQYDEDARAEGLCGYNGPEVRHPCKFDEGWGLEHDTGFCKHHNDSGAPSKSLEGNQNAVGNDSGAPEGHFRSLKTGDNTSVDRWLEFIDENKDDDFKAIFRGYWERFRDRGADPVVATRLAVLWSKADYNNMELLKEDFMRPMYHEGEYVDDVFDSERDSSALSNEREARMLRREDKLSPKSRDSDVAEGVKSIAEILGEVSDEHD